MSMIQIRPEHIYVLRNATGRPFTDHMDSLLRSSASVVGITNEYVSDNPRTNVQDGGVDTEISAIAVLFGPEVRWVGLSLNLCGSFVQSVQMYS